MKKTFLLAAAILALASCDNNDETLVASQVAMQITATIGEPVISRAIDASWAENDQIGITATIGELKSTSFQPYINLQYTYKNDGTNKFEGTDMLFYNAMTLSAYYPFTGEEGTAPTLNAEDEAKGEPFIIQTLTDSTKQNTADQAKFDFLYAQKTGIKVADAEKVNLSFSHKMSKLTFSFVNASTDQNQKMDVSKMVYYRIEGLSMEGSFNTLTGECSATPVEQSEKFLGINTKGKVEENKPLQSLIVFPQVPEIPEITPTKPNPETPGAETRDAEATEPMMIHNKARLHMYLDEAQDGDAEHYQHYHCTLSFGEEGLKPGHHYKFTVYVTKVGMIMGDMSIVKWEDVSASLAATIDGDIDLPEE